MDGITWLIQKESTVKKFVKFLNCYRNEMEDEMEEESAAISSRIFYMI